MIQYFLMSFVLIIAFFYIYIKWSHPFWCIQPVYHKYNFFFWGRKGIIRKKPVKNKFCNFRIQFYKTDEFQQWKKVQKLIAEHFLTKKNNTFTPSLQELRPYFVGLGPCYISIYTDKELKYKTSTESTESIEKIIGVITSRPLTFQTKDTKETIYYVDYLCVDKRERKKGITPQLIQTHEYNQSMVSQTQISFFKREGPVPLLVPFVKFKSTVFSMAYWKEVKHEAKYKTIRVTPDNIHVFHDFLETRIKLIDYAFYAGIGNILELIKTGNVIIYMCFADTAVSCYVFRKSCTRFKGGEILVLAASLDAGTDDFVPLFKCALSCLMKTEKGYVYLCVEELGENMNISENLQIKTSPIERIDTSYFFYNYIHPTVNAKKCFLLP
jgi:hypothetical protein